MTHTMLWVAVGLMAASAASAITLRIEHVHFEAPMCGDCDGSGDVRINEVVEAVNNALASVTPTPGASPCLCNEECPLGSGRCTEIFGVIEIGGRFYECNEAFCDFGGEHAATCAAEHCQEVQP